MNKTALIHRLIAKCRQLDNLAIDSVCKIDLLETRIKDLEESVSCSEERADHYAQVADKRAREAREAAYEADRQKRELEDREFREREIVKELNRARDFSDEWGAERALQKLKDLQRWG